MANDGAPCPDVTRSRDEVDWAMELVVVEFSNKTVNEVPERCRISKGDSV